MQKINYRFLFGVTVLAFALRLGFNFYNGFNASPGIDGIVLDRIAYHLATNQGYSILPDVPTAKKPPAFILIIAIIYKIFGVHSYAAVRILLIIFSSLTPFLVYLITKNITDEKTAKISMLLTAISPLLIYNSWWFLSNTFMYFILAFGVYFLTLPLNFWVLAAGGMSLGIASLSIQYGTVFYLPLPFMWAYFVHRNNWLKNALVITLFMLLPIFFWMARNYQIYHKIIYNNTESGIRFWGGNNPKADGSWIPWVGSARFYFDSMKPGWHDASDWIDLSSKMGPQFQDLVLNRKDVINEPEINGRYFKLGLSWIKNNPLQYLKLLAKKFFVFWHPFSSHSVSPFLNNTFRKIAFWFEFFILLSFFLGIFLSAKNWRNFLLLYLLIGHQVVMAMYHFGDIQQRMRVGNYILIFSAFAISYLWGKLYEKN